MPDPCLTLDDLIAAGNWSGAALESRQLMAGYTVDGGRFGSMPLETKSGSSNDTHLGKRVSEIWTAALVFSYLGYHKLGLISVGQDGAQLERPDFDVQLPDGEYIGLEIANVSETLERKLEAGRNAIEVSVRDRIERDSAFRAAFGSYYITLTLSGPGSHAPDLTRRETLAIIEDFVRFVSAGAHTRATSEYFSPFSAQYKTLYIRGAEYHAEPIADGPSFTVNEGAGTIGPTDRRDDVLRVLDTHRASAATYRPIPTWIFLLLTDTMEFFYNTVGTVERSKLAISPFVRGYLVDAVPRVLLIE